MSTPDWFDTAHAATLLAMDVETLNGYLNEKHPEKHFQPLGLLFDRERHAKGEPCLQLLVPKYDEADRKYDWHNALIRIQINLQPGRSPEDDRMCLVAVTSHDDLPLSMLIPQSELGKFPKAVQALLEQLREELPVRRLRYNAKVAKTGKKRAAPRPTATPAPVPSAATAAGSLSKGATQQPRSKDTQISIFGI